MGNLSAADIDVWTVSTQHFAPAGLARDILEDGERTWISRLRSTAEQDVFARGHATMRAILAKYLPLSPAALVLGRGRYGKPFLLGEYPLHFNWSHAGDYWLLAVSRSGPVGIDIEKVRTDFDWHGPAAVAFHPRECEYVERRDGDPGQRFFELWARKEAAFKGIGTGLHDDMAETSIVDDAGGLKPVVGMLDGTCWEIHTIAVPDGYAAAVASGFPRSRVRSRTDLPLFSGIDRDPDPAAAKRRLFQFRTEIVA